MTGFIIGTTIKVGAYLWFMHELRKTCDKIVGDETYEEYLKRKADELAYKQREKWNNEELV